MSEVDQVAAAKLHAVRARARLSDALAVLKHRLAPSTIANNLVETAKDKAEDAAEAGIAAAKARPGIALGAAALATLLLVGRPLTRAINRKKHETAPRPARSDADRSGKGRQ